MSPKIEISIGEHFDKVTILEIKKEKGLPVDKELDMLTQDISEFKSPLTDRLYDLLKFINGQLWVIEDEKRSHEKDNDFKEKFVHLARLVYLLNDERARIKSMIDKECNSKITEHKSHDSV